jgi:hypothetical protein
MVLPVEMLWIYTQCSPECSIKPVDAGSDDLRSLNVMRRFDNSLRTSDATLRWGMSQIEAAPVLCPGSRRGAEQPGRLDQRAATKLEASHSLSRTGRCGGSGRANRVPCEADRKGRTRSGPDFELAIELGSQRLDKRHT